MLDSETELILAELLDGIESAIGDRLLGLYLYGSLAAGGFQPGISDADLLAAINGDITSSEFARLESMHADLERRFPAWDDRIEVAYLTKDALSSFKERRSRIIVISPGDPLHAVDAGSDWLMNWHMVTHGGRTLFGPSPATLITPTTEDEFVASLCEHILDSDEWIDRARSRKAQSYVVFTMCRTLVALASGRHASKREAAEWVQIHVPEWAELANNALAWRTDLDAANRDDPASHASVVRFHAFVQAKARARSR